MPSALTRSISDASRLAALLMVTDRDQHLHAGYAWQRLVPVSGEALMRAIELMA